MDRMDKFTVLENNVPIGGKKKQFVKKFVSEQWILSCLPLVIDLSNICGCHFWLKAAA